MNKLFDKQIKIYLYDVIGGEADPTDSITMPDTGMKPNISIQAEWTTDQVVSNTNIRLTNFYPSKNLNQYRWIKVFGGYRDSSDWGYFEGEVKVAYQESPSPDGVTLISCLTANTKDVFNSLIDIHSASGDSFDSVLNQIVNALSNNSGVSWSLENSLDARSLVAPLDYNGTAKDLLAVLKGAYGFEYGYEGNTLLVCESKTGRTKIDPIEINYLSSAPAQSAAGVTFTAPWIPALRPNKIIKIDPKYFKQSFGATKVTMSTKLKCQTVTLEFNTVTQQNQMTVLALNVGDMPNE